MYKKPNNRLCACAIMNNSSEFCGEVNDNLDISDEELPKEANVDYMLEPANAATAEAETKGMLLYCIDISGSMSSTVRTPNLQGEYINCSFVLFFA